MKKNVLIGLALAALAQWAAAQGIANAMTRAPDPVTAQNAANAQRAASTASAAANAASADRAATAAMRQDAASAAGMSAVNAATTAEDREKAEKAAAEAKKALAATKAAAKQQASAHKGYTWSHFGVDPYAKSRDEAMRKRHDVFVGMGLPPVVIERFMKATEEEGTSTAIANGQRLDVMMEGSGMRRDVLVDLDAKLVPAAEVWETTFNGTTYKLYLPKICNNWSLVKELPRAEITAQAPPAAAAPPATGEGCPSGWTITVHEWSVGSLPADLRRETESLIEAAKQRDSRQARVLEVYRPDDVSRTMGGRLRKQVRVHATMLSTVQLRLLDPATLRVVRDLGPLQLVGGSGVMAMPEDPRKYVVETLFPGEFVSPTVSGGVPRLRLFGYEWRNWCNMNEHGLVP
jgi:hypothetical protein